MAYHSKYSGVEVDALLGKIKDDNVGSIDSSLSTTSENPVKNKVITEELNKKVDKVEGKQLSTEDFTSELKGKLDGLSNYDDTNLKGELEVLKGKVDEKQDYIADLDSIRSGASKGSTAIQEHQDISHLLPKSDFDTYATKTDSQLTELDERLVDFTGTDGTNPGNHGLVPAPTAEDVSKVLGADGTWKSIPDSNYFYNENVAVNTNPQRFKNISLKPGSKFVVKITAVSGTSNIFNLQWDKNGIYEQFVDNYMFGYPTDVFVVPDDAIGIRIFMNPAASGNLNKIEIWNAEMPGFIVEKVGPFGIDYLNNRKMISKTISIPAGNGLIELLTIKEAQTAKLSGDIYAYISASPKFPKAGVIDFWNIEDISSASVSIHGLEMRQDRVFKIFSNKTLRRVLIQANSVSEDTELTITIFAVDNAISYLNYPLFGKKIMCFGDSITEFKNSKTLKRYSDYLQEYSQADVYNAGIGGTRYAQRLTPSLSPTGNQECIAAFDICNMVIAWATEDYSFQEAALVSGHLTEHQQTLFESKLSVLKNNPISGCDIVTIMAGANDYRGGSPIGLENQETMDKGTIRGAINAMVSAILMAKPTIEINFFSPLIYMDNQVGIDNSSDVVIAANAPDGMTFPAYIEKIHDAVKGTHCPFHDMYWTLGWNVYNFSTFFTTDNTHPDSGYKVIAERMYKYLLAR